MSIYFLRHGNLIKIGYSSDLPRRVRAIMGTVPVDVAFVGHMPGDREVEGWLHGRFEASRFSGEWFVETPDLVEFARIALDPVMPVEPATDRVIASRQPMAIAKMEWAKSVFRAYGLSKWPASSHGERALLIAEETGWLLSRVQDIYRGNPRAVLRATELATIEAMEPEKITTNREIGRGSEQ